MDRRGVRLSKSVQNKILRKSGFTLVELLLYSVLVGTIILFISYFLQTTLVSRVKNQTEAEVEQESLRAIQIMTQIIRNSSEINSPSTGTSATSLSLNAPANNPTVFDLSGGRIRVDEGTGAIFLTSDRISVSNLNFYNVSGSGTNGSLKITFTANHLNPDGRNEWSYSRQFFASASLRQ